MLFFHHWEIDDKYLICGRSSAFRLSGGIVLVQPRGGAIRRYRTTYYLSSSSLSVVFLPWSPFPCFVLCFFVPGTLTCAVFPSGGNSILYANGHPGFGFLATFYFVLYSLGLFGEVPSGDIGFDTYMCGRSEIY